jgi:GH35 family endo-1,4-beta-xylanase
MWVNEGTILASRRRRRHYENMIRTLCRTDAAPDGIGLMGHFNAPRYPSVQQLHQVLDRYAALVPRLQITELDIRTGGDEYAQAEYLRTLMTAAFSHPAVESIMCWGFWAGRHPRPDAALFYRRNWTLKPAGAVWRELVFNEWWTDEVLHTDAEGYVSTHGFLGDYRIDVMHEGRTQQRNLILVPQGLSETIVMG